jgi:hypothetical protein
MWVRGSPKAWREPRRRLNLRDDMSGWEAHIREGGRYGQQRMTHAAAAPPAAADGAKQPKLGWGVKGPDTAEKARYRARGKKAKPSARPSARPAVGPNVVTRAAAAKAANAEAKKTAKAPVAPAAIAARIDAGDPLAC